MSKRTRRKFLGESMAVAAATAATPSLLLADDSAESTSPNEKLGVAVVGANGRGNSHIGYFAGRNDTEVTWICDVDSAVGERRCDEVANRQGGRRPEFAEDLRTVLEDDSVDIVTIATPNHWHSLGAVWAMQAGKDVYLEKPISHNVQEGRSVVEAARKYQRICQTGTQCRSARGIIEAMEFLHNGQLGEVRLARGLCYKPRRSIGGPGQYDPPATVNYDLWLGPAPMAEITRPQFHYDWHWQWPYGCGDLGNQGIHQMDLARWGLGLDALPQGVLGYGGRFAYTDAGNTPNTEVCLYDYGDKSIVFEVRGLNTAGYHGASIGVEFVGTEGTLTIWSYSDGAARDHDGNEIARFGGGGDHFGNFLSAVRSRKGDDLNSDALEGHLSSALCHLGNISWRLGTPMSLEEAEEKIETLPCTDDVQSTLQRTVEHLADNNVDLGQTPMTVGDALAFDAQSETFTESDVANALLTREYREPFVVPATDAV